MFLGNINMKRRIFEVFNNMGLIVSYRIIRKTMGLNAQAQVNIAVVLARDSSRLSNCQ
jgi:hypothetical protein